MKGRLFARAVLPDRIPLPRQNSDRFGLAANALLRPAHVSMHHVDGFLRDRVERSDGLRIGFECPLRDDQI